MIIRDPSVRRKKKPVPMMMVPPVGCQRRIQGRLVELTQRAKRNAEPRWPFDHREIGTGLISLRANSFSIGNLAAESSIIPEGGLIRGLENGG